MKVAIALVCLLAGCASSFAELPPDDPRRLSAPERYDQEWNKERERDEGLAQIQTRAAFDLHCEHPRVHVLERLGGDGYPILVGAECDGRQVQYDRRLRRSGWTGNLTTRNSRWQRVGERPPAVVEVSVQ